MFNPFSMISSFLEPEKPYEAAEKAANKYYKEGIKYQLPFLQQGQQQFPLLMGAEERLLHPEQLQSEWANAYEMSPYAKNLLGENTEQGLEAASRMGLLGSSGALQNIQKGAGEIVAKDRQQFLNDLMQKFLSGIGLGQGIYGTGASTAQNIGQQAVQHGTSMGGLEAGRVGAPGQLFGNLLGTGLSTYGNMQIADALKNLAPPMLML